MRLKNFFGQMRLLPNVWLVDDDALDGKKYMDDVYTLGHGHLYANDGRTRQNPSKQYGTGGLLNGKSICFQ
ncbi:Modulator of drug activity B [Providencia rettgeri]|nr:Modulator of drug activity B [Providencia rettgeri]